MPSFQRRDCEWDLIRGSELGKLLDMVGHDMHKARERMPRGESEVGAVPGVLSGEASAALQVRSRVWNKTVWKNKVNKTLSAVSRISLQVTDRLATVGLLMVLSVKNRAYFFHCMGLVLLDIASHWLQMYSQLLSAKQSHKDVDSSAFFVLRLYYTNRIFMGICCVSAEVIYLCAHAASDSGTGGVGAIKGPIPASALAWTGLEPRVVDTAVAQIALLMFPGWCIKQVANIAQLWNSVQALVRHDFPQGKKRR